MGSTLKSDDIHSDFTDNHTTSEQPLPMVLEEYEKDIDFQTRAKLLAGLKRSGDLDNSILGDKARDLPSIKETEEEKTPRSQRRTNRKKTTMKNSRRKTIKLLDDTKGDNNGEGKPEPKSDSRSSLGKSRKSVSSIPNAEEPVSPKKKRSSFFERVGDKKKSSLLVAELKLDKNRSSPQEAVKSDRKKTITNEELSVKRNLSEMPQLKSDRSAAEDIKTPDMKRVLLDLPKSSRKGEDSARSDVQKSTRRKSDNKKTFLEEATLTKKNSNFFEEKKSERSKKGDPTPKHNGDSSPKKSFDATPKRTEEFNVDGYKPESGASIKSIKSVPAEDQILAAVLKDDIARINSEDDDPHTEEAESEEEEEEYDDFSEDEEDIDPTLLNPNVEEERYRQDPRFSKLKWIIFPDDTFKSYWDILIALNLMYTATFIPYVVAFVEESPDWLDFLDYTFNVIWGIDLILNFFSAYEDKNEELVFSKRKIAKKYLLSWFVVDAVSIFPFSFVLDSNKSYNSLARIARLPRLSRFLKLAKILRVLKFFKERSKILQYLSDWLKLRPGIDRFAAVMFYFFLFCHITSSVWYIQADFNSDDPTSWVNIYPDENDTSFHSYIASFYFVVTTVVTVGYGDIHAHNTTERMICCVIMFVGAFIYSYIVGSLSSMILSMDSRSRELDGKLKALINIKQQYSIESQLYNKIRRALKYGHTRFYEDKISFLNELPTRLRTQLSIIMHRELLKNIEFFKGRNPAFLGIIGPLLKPIHLSQLDYVFTEGEYANEMYFIKAGEVEIVLKNFNNLPFMKIDSGFYFGEVDLLFNETREYSYRAKTDCELLALSKKNFEKIFFQEFRQIGQEIQNNALKRRERVRKRYKEALAYCLNEANQPKEPIEHTKSLTDANNTTLSSPSNLGPIDNKFSKSAESGDIRKKNPFFAKKLMDIASKIRATTQPGTQTPVGSDTDSKADSNTEEQKFRSGFKVENLVDVVRTPKRRNSMHHASTAEIINSDRPHNSDHEGKSPKTKKTMLSSFSSYANKLKNDAQNSDSTPVKDNGELIEINENKSEGSHAKMWGKLNGLLHPDGKSKLQKSFSTKNVMKPILPDKKDLLFKNQNASKFVSLLDMKLKKKKINEPLHSKVDRLELMLDEIIGHFGSRLEEVQSQPPDPGSMKTSLEASLHSAQSAPIDHKKAFLKNKTKSFKNLEVVKNLKPDPKNDIEEVVNSSNESKLPKLNIQSNHLLALLNKNKAKSASLGSQNSLDL